MSAEALVAVAKVCPKSDPASAHILSGCGYPAPGLPDFDFSPVFSIGSFHVYKPELLMVLCVIVIVAFFWAAFHKPEAGAQGHTEPG